MPESKELDRLRVVLVGTRNPLNLGAAARAMSNFGVRRLRVVNPYEPSLLEARSAVGPAAELLANAEQFSSLADAVADCALIVGTTAIQHRDLQHPMHRLDVAASLIQQQLAGANVAVVFGSEKTGLSNDNLSHCHWLLHIPARDEHLSMNLGQAVAVTLYELAREVKATPASQGNITATAEELERVTAVLLELLDLSGYTSPETTGAAKEKARRMIHRMSLNSRDAEVLLGMLRQIIWKLQH